MTARVEKVDAFDCNMSDMILIFSCVGDAGIGSLGEVGDLLNY